MRVTNGNAIRGVKCCRILNKISSSYHPRFPLVIIVNSAEDVKERGQVVSKAYNYAGVARWSNKDKVCATAYTVVYKLTCLYFVLKELQILSLLCVFALLLMQIRVFDCRLILVPLNYSNTHWALAAIYPQVSLAESQYINFGTRCACCIHIPNVSVACALLP